MRIQFNFNSEELRDIIGATCSPRGKNEIVEDMYINLCKAVISSFFKLYDGADAFIRSCFYLCDLMDNQVITPAQVKELDEYTHNKAIERK